MICHKCGNEVSDTDKFCRKCGAKKSKTCTYCGTLLFDGDTFCGECGNVVIQMQSIEKDKPVEEPALYDAQLQNINTYDENIAYEAPKQKKKKSKKWILIPISVLLVVAIVLGSMFAFGVFDNDIMISAGNYHTVYLKADGTVVAVGNNRDGQCNVYGWKDIIAISAGLYHTVGLKSDGTVVAVGENGDGQCDVSKFNK